MSLHWGGSYRRKVEFSPLRRALDALSACHCQDAEGGVAARRVPAPRAAAAAPPWVSRPGVSDRTAT